MLGATRNLEKRIVLLIVNLQFSKLSENGVGDLFVDLHLSDSVYWPNQDNQRSKSLPKLTTSHSLTKSVKQNLKNWRPVWRSGKVEKLSVYQPAALPLILKPIPILLVYRLRLFNLSFHLQLSLNSGWLWQRQRGRVLTLHSVVPGLIPVKDTKFMLQLLGHST